MSDENVIDFASFGRRRFDLSKCRHRGGFEVDPSNGDVRCMQCSQLVSPQHALVSIVSRWEQLDEARQRYKAEVEELKRYEPHLRAAKRVESIWRSKMLPACPHCNKGIEADVFGFTRVWNPKRVRGNRKS